MITSTCESRRLGWRHPVKAALLALTACLAFTTNLHAETLVFAKHGFKIDTYDYTPPDKFSAVEFLRFGNTKALNSTIYITATYAGDQTMHDAASAAKNTFPNGQITINGNIILLKDISTEDKTKTLTFVKSILENKMLYEACAIIKNPPGDDIPEEIKTTINSFSMENKKEKGTKLKYRAVEINEQAPSSVSSPAGELIFMMNTTPEPISRPANFIAITSLKASAEITLKDYIKTQIKPTALYEKMELSNETTGPNEYSCDYTIRPPQGAPRPATMGHIRIVQKNNIFYGIKGCCSAPEWQGISRFYIMDCIKSFTLINN